LTNAQWAQVEPLLPRPSPVLGGRLPVISRRLLIDTVLYGAGQRLRLADGAA
jgi:hypothetical protein